ncbi:MAG: helix-hairpin-helix domain-containing protein [Coriobacteriales bacterium]|jgi:competence protein ComEA|nr:helix-hairpin-helix domain-containing protein [Coriobacteriales bacterium]
MKGCTNYTDEATRWAQPSGGDPGKGKGKGRFKIGLVLVLGIVATLLVFVVFPRMGDDSFTVATAQEMQDKQTQASATSEQTPEPTPETAPPALEEPLIVYLTGAVAQPGVYELEQGARLNDAIVAAGGLVEGSASNYINLAAALKDGAHIHIPSILEIESGEAARIEAGGASRMTDGAAGTTGTADGAEASVSQGEQKVNINTADSAQLETLPGIGPATSKRIIDYREKNGAFKRIEDLKNVSGIGDKKYAELADKIRV